MELKIRLLLFFKQLNAVGEVDLKLGSGENFCPLQTRTDEEEER
jgi:hypothetical protein